jgi:hypothetical protein
MKTGAHDILSMEKSCVQNESILKLQIPSQTDDESGFSEVSISSVCTSPIQIDLNEVYELAGSISDESKKELQLDLCSLFHGEFQLTFGRYFTPHIWTLLPLNVDGSYKFPSDAACNVEIAKVRFECEICDHRWTSMHGQISFFYDCRSHVLFFKLFNQNCDRCQNLCTPLWYPEEVCRVMRNVFVIVNQRMYAGVHTSIKSNHCRRLGNTNGRHHGCESCRSGICAALIRQQLNCELVR